MKKLVVLLFIVALATTGQAQDSTQFIPDYGIELEGYSDVKTFVNDTIDLRVEIKFMSPIFQSNEVLFLYDVKTYNDTLLVEHKQNYTIKAPLNATVQGKKVYEWLNLIYSPNDTIVLKVLSEKLYYYDLMNK
jgi:hypothetical protein